MKKSVKHISVLTVLSFLILLALGQVALAQDEKLWPKSVPVVTVGFGAGGGTDTAVRPVIAKIEEYLGETINVVNMEGASSAVAAEHVLSLPADGYNMFATGSGPLSGFRVMGTSNTTWRDWVSWHAFSGGALLVRNDSTIDTFDEAIRVLKKKTKLWYFRLWGEPSCSGEAIRNSGCTAPNLFCWFLSYCSGELQEK